MTSRLHNQQLHKTPVVRRGHIYLIWPVMKDHRAQKHPGISLTVVSVLHIWFWMLFLLATA